MDIQFRADVEKRFTAPPTIVSPEQRQVAVSYARLAVEIAGRLGNRVFVQDALIKLEESRNTIIRAMKTEEEERAVANPLPTPSWPRLQTE